MAVYEYHQYQAFKLKSVESIRHRKDCEAFRQAELRSARADSVVEVWRAGHRIAVASQGMLVLVQAAPRHHAPIAALHNAVVKANSVARMTP